MNNRNLIIYDFNSLYNILEELNLNINFNVLEASNEKLLNEVTNLVEKPKILVCEFDKRFLNIPNEILVTTMQTHQKYFSTKSYK